MRHQDHDLLKAYNMLFYFAGSMIMHEPSEDCIVDFWKRGILKTLPVSSSNPNFIKASYQLRESYADKTFFGKLLHEDFLRLFSEPGPVLAPAIESYYERKIIYDTQFPSSNATEFYNSYGWNSKFKGRIADDHLGIELLFLTLLIDKYLNLEDEACRGEMKKEIFRFVNFHILSWVPQWNRKIQSHAMTLSFKGIGNLILACSEDIFAIFSKMPATSGSLDFIKN